MSLHTWLYFVCLYLRNMLLPFALLVHAFCEPGKKIQSIHFICNSHSTTPKLSTVWRWSSSWSLVLTKKRVSFHQTRETFFLRFFSVKCRKRVFLQERGGRNKGAIIIIVTILRPLSKIEHRLRMTQCMHVVWHGQEKRRKEMTTFWGRDKAG